MSCIHYKFRNNAKHDTIQFDGAYISVGEIKQTILGQKKMGKAPDFMLQIINAQTQEAYNDDNQLIPRNAEVTVKRIPTGNKVSKSQLAAQSTSLDMYKMSTTPLPLSVSMENDLTKTEGSEQDKLKAIMMQQAMAYDNPNANKRGGNDEELPLNYVCHRCNTPGHLIRNCPTNGNFTYDGRGPRPARKMTLSLKKKEAPGSEMTADEKKQMEQNQKSTSDKVRCLAQEAFTNTPPEMKCPVCQQLMVDACLSTCCGQSFCDECIRERLLDETICPACGDEVTPGQLISNKALRVTISKYKKDHQDRIAKLYSECHIQTNSRGSTPKPDQENSASPRNETATPHSKPLVDATSNLTLQDTKQTSSTSVSTADPGVSVAKADTKAPVSVSLAPSSLPTMIPRLSTLAPPPGMPPTVGPLIVPPVAILDPMEPPPVAILPLKEEIKSDVPEVKKTTSDSKDLKAPSSVKRPVIPVSGTSSILPMPNFPPPPLLPLLQPLPMLPFNPLMAPSVGPVPGPLGLLPPPLPLPEPVAESKNDRILDSSEFYAIQKELRRLQEKRRSRSSSRSRSASRSSHSPPSRNSRGSSPPPGYRHHRPHDNQYPSKRRQEGPPHHRMWVERPAPHFERRGLNMGYRGRGGMRVPVKNLIERNVRNDRARALAHEQRSYDSDERRTDHNEKKGRTHDKKEKRHDHPSRGDSDKMSREVSDPSVKSPVDSSKVDDKPKKKKDKDHKKKKHKKKEKKDKKNRREKTEASKPSLTEYSASDETSDEDEEPNPKINKNRSRSRSPSNHIIAPRAASPSPDRFEAPTRSPPPDSPPNEPTLEARMSPVPVSSSQSQESDSPPRPSLPVSPLLTPVSASPLPTPASQDAQSPVSRSDSPAALVIASPSPPRESPRPQTPSGTPTAKGGVTPQFGTKEDSTPQITNGLSSDGDEDEVSISMNVSDREVNGASSTDDSESEPSNNTEDYIIELKRKCKEAGDQLKELRDKRLAEKKKRKKKKKKKKAKEEEKKKKKHKKKNKEDLEEGEIVSKPKKRKRSQSIGDSQESLEIELKKKTKKSKSSKKDKDEPPAPTKSKGVEIKVNFTPLKDNHARIHTNTKTISISSPPKTESRRVHIGVSEAKPLKIKTKLTDIEKDDEDIIKPKKIKSHKKSKHKISKSAVSGIEDDPDNL